MDDDDDDDDSNISLKRPQKWSDANTLEMSAWMQHFKHCICDQ